MDSKKHRIPVSGELHEKLRTFRNALGASDYESAINFMLKELAAGYNVPDDGYSVGYKLNPAYRKSTQSKTANV